MENVTAIVGLRVDVAAVIGLVELDGENESTLGTKKKRCNKLMGTL